MRRYVAAVDLFLNAMVLFLIAVILMLPLLNPPTQEEKADPPGNLIISIVWPQGSTDVDLWVFGPTEVRPVGYSNKAGKFFNLLRDDLGTSGDTTPINYENAYTRGVIAGDYTVNLHLYATAQMPPIVVDVEIAIVTGDERQLRKLATTRIKLTERGQEKTALRFHLTADGKIQGGSMNAVFKPLRSAKP